MAPLGEIWGNRSVMIRGHFFPFQQTRTRTEIRFYYQRLSPASNAFITWLQCVYHLVTTRLSLGPNAFIRFLPLRLSTWFHRAYPFASIAFIRLVQSVYPLASITFIHLLPSCLSTYFHCIYSLGGQEEQRLNECVLEGNVAPQRHTQGLTGMTLDQAGQLA